MHNYTTSTKLSTDPSNAQLGNPWTLRRSLTCTLMEQAAPYSGKDMQRRWFETHCEGGATCGGGSIHMTGAVRDMAALFQEWTMESSKEKRRAFHSPKGQSYHPHPGGHANGHGHGTGPWGSPHWGGLRGSRLTELHELMPQSRRRRCSGVAEGMAGLVRALLLWRPSVAVVPLSTGSVGGRGPPSKRGYDDQI